ncbi:hypothetical protein HGA88_06425 [Candidatus Roizmanbacteria bacterium]|nr:hypothetical protein [Candidatus Roizmanbacteria bacterium]
MKKRLFLLFAIVVISFSAYSYLTNPFHTITIIQNPFTTFVQGDQIEIRRNFRLQIRKDILSTTFAQLKCAFHIVSNVYFGSQKSKSSKVDEIIAEIHQLRFDPAKPYLISGDHFSVLYPRNLGVFYLATLDQTTALDRKDWLNRQQSYLLATAYGLEAFTQAGRISTTIVPVAPQSVSLLNIYAYPSDSLYGLLYALKTLQTPNEATSSYHLQTVSAAKTLERWYAPKLTELINNYVQTVYDPQTQLVKTSIHLSGAKDITKRTSAFYDNVILWKTLSLAKELGFNYQSQIDLSAYKQKILSTYWYPRGGYFLEDLSPASMSDHYYSSDWLAAFFTGFLDPKNPNELPYFEKSVAYLHQQQIDRPFGLKYQQQDRATRQFPLVRIFVPSYGGSSIWSFWGAEYIKLLHILSQGTGKTAYEEEAQYQIAQYDKNIVKYRGYPELYDEKGEMLSGLFYKSIRMTGWVVDFESARK